VWRLQTESARSRRTRRGNQRGTTLVEAAIVTLPFFMFIFAVVEVGLQLASSHSVTGAVQAGSRTASAAVSDLEADYTILQSIKKELSGLPRGYSQIVRIVVYRTTSTAQPPSATCKAGTPVGPPAVSVCNVYTAADLARPITNFGCFTGTPVLSPDRFWCPTTRKSALTAPDGPPDYVGIYIEVRHQRVAGLVGSTKFVSDYAVLRLEPSKR
jgi:Flp pilus assembly protein TadG